LYFQENQHFMVSFIYLIYLFTCGLHNAATAICLHNAATAICLHNAATAICLHNAATAICSEGHVTFATFCI